MKFFTRLCDFRPSCLWGNCPHVCSQRAFSCGLTASMKACKICTSQASVRDADWRVSCDLASYIPCTTNRCRLRASDTPHFHHDRYFPPGLFTVVISISVFFTLESFPSGSFPSGRYPRSWFAIKVRIVVSGLVKIGPSSTWPWRPPTACLFLRGVIVY